MVLSTHAAVGAALATFFPTHPEVAFLAGFTSHFLLDSIPHWDYHLVAWHKDPHDTTKNDLVFTRNTLVDFVKIGADVIVGFFAVWILFASDSFGLALISLLSGAVGGMTPDALQFLYYRSGRRFLRPLQRFHNWIHAGGDLNSRPFLGIFLQLVAVVVLTIIVNNV